MGSNFFKNATKVGLFRVGRNIGVTSSNPVLLGSIQKTLKAIGFVCNENTNTKTITVTNTERFLPPVYFMTEVKEAIIKSGYTLKEGPGSRLILRPQGATPLNLMGRSRTS